MGQRSLFEAGRQRPVDDHTGTIEYRPGWVPGPLATAWFEGLRQGIGWQSRRRTMYERELDVPRLLAAFDLDERLPAPLDAIVARVRAEFPTPFTSVGLNLYRDGRDSVAPHHDRLAELVPGHPIVLLSLGAVRRMVIRARDPPRRTLQLDLEPGSLLTMSYPTQLHYLHGIPKQRAPVAARISLAFRVRRAVQGGGAAGRDRGMGRADM